MSDDGVTISNAVGFAIAWAVYEAFLVGGYVFAFRFEVVDRVDPRGWRELLATLLGLPDVVAVGAVAALLSAGAATGAFLSYPKPNVVDLIGPGGPSGTMRVITMVNVGFRALFWGVVGTALAPVVYLRWAHPGSVPAESFAPNAYLEAALGHPESVLIAVFGGVLGTVLGALSRPTRSTSSMGGGGGDGDGGE